METKHFLPNRAGLGQGKIAKISSEKISGDGQISRFQIAKRVGAASGYSAENRAVTLSSQGQYKLSIHSCFPLLTILEFSLNLKVNEHAKIRVCGILDLETWESADGAEEGQLVKAILTNESDKTEQIIFSGIMSSMQLNQSNDTYMILMEAVSHTFLLDLRKESRSFQNTDSSYYSILEDVFEKHDGEIYSSDQDAQIEFPVIQYRETPWEFANRMASCMNTVVVPILQSEVPSAQIGISKQNYIGELPKREYHIAFDKSYYICKDPECSKRDFTYYEFNSFVNFDIGDYASASGQTMLITEKTVTLQQGALVFHYKLMRERGIWRNKFANMKLEGSSITGTVLETAQELVKLHLHIDDSQDIKEAYPFTWRPETGNLMYLMPKVGSIVRLYFSDRYESSGICIDCIRENGTDCPETQNPNNRYLVTEDREKMYMKPEQMGFISEMSTSSLEINDTDGAMFSSKQTLNIKATNDISIQGKNLTVTAPKECSTMRRSASGPSVINLCNNVDSVGTIGGFMSTMPLKTKQVSGTPEKKTETIDVSEIEDDILSTAAPNYTEQKIATAVLGTNVMTVHVKGVI